MWANLMPYDKIVNMIRVCYKYKYMDNLVICKVQLNVYKRLFDNEYPINIHDICSYSCI